MEIQTKKQSDLEKRLRLLHQQVYGRQSSAISYQSEGRQLKPESYSDTTYLHQELLKIFILAGSALGFQIILFILSKNHILNLNFF